MSFGDLGATDRPRRSVPSFGVTAMRTETRKHLSVVGGLAKFAQVTVGRADFGEKPPTEPQVYLNERPVPSLSGVELEIVEAARRGIRQIEDGLGWQGPQHFVLKIEGLEVDGIDADAACSAAGEATRALIGK